MKILSITQTYYYNFQSPLKRRSDVSVPKFQKIERNNMYAYPPVNITFGNIANSEPLRKLFAYGLPDIYTGRTMIDSSLFERLLRADIFTKPAKYSIPVLSSFRNCYFDIQRKVFEKMARRAKTHPDEDLQELLIGLSKDNKKKLRSMQQPIFDDLDEMSKNLPFKEQEAYDDLMRRTKLQLNDKKVVTTFNKFQFQYKLSKIRDDVYDIISPKTSKLVERMIKMSDNLSDVDSVETRDAQRLIIKEIESLMNANSSLKDYMPLKQLIIGSIARLNKEAVLLPFSRKAYISELEKIVEHIKDTDLKEKMLLRAKDLPTSKDAVEAYIMKYKDSMPDKIAFRLAHLSFASVEHIFPKSMGGPDDMANFAGANVAENSARGNIPFVEQLKRRPDTPKYCQKFVDRLIELEKEGIFKKHNIDSNYIEDFAETIYQESEGRIDLDISALYK